MSIYRVFNKPSKPIVEETAGVASRQWLSTADEVLGVLRQAREVQVFSETAEKTAPLAVFADHGQTDTLGLLKEHSRGGGKAGAKPRTQGWLVLSTRARSYGVSYDFHNGLLVAGADQVVTVNETVRERLLALFKATEAKSRTGGSRPR